MANGDRLVPVTIHRSKDVISEVVDCLVMNVVFDFQPAGGFAVGRVDGGVPDVLGVLNQGWVIVEISCCVEVEICKRLDCFEEQGRVATDMSHDIQVSSSGHRMLHCTQSMEV